MIGGLTGRPVANSTGPGSPTPTPRTSAASRPISLEQLVERMLEPRQHLVGALRDGDLVGVLGEHLAREVGHRHT